MRILYLSRADAFNDTSSLVNIARDLLLRMIELDDEFFVQWVVPRGAKDADLERMRSEAKDPERLQFVKVQAGLSGRTLGYLMNEDLWYTVSQMKATVPYDVLLTNQLALTPIWKTLLANRYQASRWNVDVPIVNWQMWTATLRQLEEVPEYYAGEADVVAESMASLFAHNVWESEVLYASHLETMEQYLLPETIEIVKRQSEVISNGSDLGRLEPAREARAHSARNTPTLFWGGRLANQKKPRVTFPLMESIRQATDVPVLVSTNRPASDPDVEWTMQTFPEWEVHGGVNSRQFVEYLGRGDVFLCNSASESYGLAWLEMLAVGMLGVFEDAWWVRKLLPEWYPFVTANRHDQALTAIALLRAWPDGGPWTELVPKTRAWLEQEHDSQVAAGRLLSTLRWLKEGAVTRASLRHGTMHDLAKSGATQAWNEWVRMGHGDDPLPAHRVWDAMKALSRNGREFGKQGDMVTPMYLRRMLEAAGWRDVCRGPQVEFVPPR